MANNAEWLGLIYFSNSPVILLKLLPIKSTPIQPILLLPTQLTPGLSRDCLYKYFHALALVR
jgi:hypothetical protein